MLYSIVALNASEIVMLIIILAMLYICVMISFTEHTVYILHHQVPIMYVFIDLGIYVHTCNMC